MKTVKIFLALMLITVSHLYFPAITVNASTMII